MSNAANIKVAVRVRPFNTRENNEKCKNIVSMNGATTKIGDEGKQFIYDYSFWSFDQFSTNSNGYHEPTSKKYADQKFVFEMLGKPLLENAWKGYNNTLFAYGQTGSGKTYSILGYHENKGLIPNICESLFQEIEKKSIELKDEIQYQVEMGMLEIYNEKIKDLLNNYDGTNLEVKENTTEKYFYAANQTMKSIISYADFQNTLAIGNKNKTIAKTRMNETSSRAHTIVTINFRQYKKQENKGHTISSKINLVDLAGSEQVKKSEATGDRLEEAKHINKSLSTLGQCLKALSIGQTHVPYRDSKITMLLKHSLMGNSKTVLLAAISPAESNHSESVSTLRFADRAKEIKTQARINISAENEIIKNLKSEKERLLEIINQLKKEFAINAANKDTNEDKEQWIKDLQRQIEETQKLLEFSQKSQQEQIKSKEIFKKEQEQREKERLEKLEKFPHLFNLNEDPSLNKVIQHCLDKPKLILGNSKADPSPNQQIDINLQGLEVNALHAQIEKDSSTNKIYLIPLEDSLVYVNGTKINKSTKLNHFDRILFGKSMYFYVNTPKNSMTNEILDSNMSEPTYEMAREELTQKQFSFKDDWDRLSADISDCYQSVEEANVYVQVLNKKINYSVIILGPRLPFYNCLDKPKVVIRALIIRCGLEYFWSIEEFKDLFYDMVDIYNDFRLTGKEEILENDPFFPDRNRVTCLGFAHIILPYLLNQVTFDEPIELIDWRGKIVGSLSSHIAATDIEGIVLEDKLQHELKIDEILNFAIETRKLELNKYLTAVMHVQYDFNKSILKTSIKEIDQSNKVDFQNKLLHSCPITNEVYSTLQTGVLHICLMAEQTKTKKSSSIRSDLDCNFVEELKKYYEEAKKNGKEEIKITDIDKIINNHQKPSNQSSRSDYSIMCCIS